MALPDGMGVQAVYDHADANVMFAPIESDAAIIFNELEVGSMDTVPTYTLEQNPFAVGAGEESHILRLDKLPVFPLDMISFVDVMMIVPLSEMDDFDEVSIPSGAEDSLVRQVVDIMSKKPKADTNNDMVFDKSA
jgi:hypothetical protein